MLSFSITSLIPFSVYKLIYLINKSCFYLTLSVLAANLSSSYVFPLVSTPVPLLFCRALILSISILFTPVPSITITLFYLDYPRYVFISIPSPVVNCHTIIIVPRHQLYTFLLLLPNAELSIPRYLFLSTLC